jgi:hypothetical protein
MPCILAVCSPHAKTLDNAIAEDILFSDWLLFLRVIVASENCKDEIIAVQVCCTEFFFKLVSY